MIAHAPTCDAPCTTGANTALTDVLLSDRERALVVLTTVLVLEDHDLIEQAVGCAQQMGITNAEIGQTSAIVPLFTTETGEETTAVDPEHHRPQPLP